MPGEMLAHPCPPEPRVDATGTGAGKREKGHVQPSSPLGPGGLCGVMSLCLSTLKLLLDVPWIREILGKSLSEAALSIHLAPNSMEHPSPAVSVPAQHPSLFQHPHPALTGPQGSKATPAASLCSCCCPPARLQDSARGIWECHSTHSHPSPQPVLLSPQC